MTTQLTHVQKMQKAIWEKEELEEHLKALGKKLKTIRAERKKASASLRMALRKISELAVKCGV